MSHFMTLVLTASPAEVNDALAPFEENNYDTCDPKFLVFQDDEAAHREKWETERRYLWQTPDGRHLTGSEEDFFEPLSVQDQKIFLASSHAERQKLAPKGWRQVPCPKTGKPIVSRMLTPAGYVKVEVALRDLEPDFDAWLAGYAGEPDEATGRHGQWVNPNAMWDGWSYGGRYSGLLLVAEGAEVGIGHFDRLKRGVTKRAGVRADQARLRDILLDDMLTAARAQMAQEWDNLQSPDTPRELRDFMLGKAMTRSGYIDSLCHPIVPYALVLNGVWHQEADESEAEPQTEAETGVETDGQEPDGLVGGNSGTESLGRLRLVTCDGKGWPDYVMTQLSGIDADTWVSVVDCHS